MAYTIEMANQAAQVLVARRRHGMAGDVLPPACRPQTLEAALQVQAAVTDLLAAETGDGVCGWKCGLPSPDKVVVAPIYEHSLQHHEPCLVWATQSQVKIEPELAFLMGRDLPPCGRAYTPQDIDAAIASTHLALELIHDRYAADAGAQFADRLADGLVNQGLWLGPAIPSEQGVQAHQIDIRMDVDDCPGEVVKGVHPAPQPRDPLYWLVNHLCERGLTLKAGQVVITGSYAGAPWVPVDKSVQVHFMGLGVVSTRFVARGA